MWGEEEWRGYPVLALLVYSCHKVPGLTSQPDGQITIDRTYDFTINALWSDLGFKPGIFGTETSEWGSAPSSVLDPRTFFY